MMTSGSRWRSRFAVCLLLAASAAGCAGHRAPVAGALPPAATFSTVEASNPELSAALLRLALLPTAASHRRVAEAYYRAGILDKAHDYLARAARIDPADGWAYEGMARILRDWGAPGLGLADAHRATYYLPLAPEAHNTLGTLLFALGGVNAARLEFEQALALAPGADYALSNLCYVAVSEGRSRDAVAACTRAVEASPGGTGVRNNLALAYAIDGRLDDAAREFVASGHPAGAQYNLGVLFLAVRRYEDAATAFAAAARLDPTLPFVAQRARQASVLAGGSDGRH
jgi:Flp pilus assembly protein TadD